MFRSGARQSMADAVAINGLELDHATITNGDCGLDAILRNLERLDLSDDTARLVLAQLPRGRQKVLDILRFKLLIWLQKNRSMEIVPGVSVSDWVLMEGNPSWEAYVKSMKVPGTWIDTAMLMAASALFNIQFVCFLGAGEAHLLAAPPIAASAAEVPIAFVANSHNVHVFACHPCTTSAQSDDAGGPASARDGVEEQAEDSLCAASEPFDGSPLSEDQCFRHIRRREPPDDLELLAVSQCLNSWSDAFGAPSPDMLNAIRAAECADVSDLVATTFEVLRWRDSVKLLQWEMLESQAGLPRECVYQLGRRHLKDTASTSEAIGPTTCVGLSATRVLVRERTFDLAGTISTSSPGKS